MMMSARVLRKNTQSAEEQIEVECDKRCVASTDGMSLSPAFRGSQRIVIGYGFAPMEFRLVVVKVGV